MLTRRELIQLGAAFAGTGTLAEARAFGRVRSVQFSAILADANSSDAVVFGRAATARGMRLHPVGADMTELYLAQLSRGWRADVPMAVGGLTRAEHLFVIERLAWDVGARIVFLGRHADHEGTTAHALKGAGVAVDRFYSAIRLSDWRIAIAHTLLEVPCLTPALQPLSAVRDAVIEGDPALFSWVIAPVPRRRGVAV